MWLETRFPVSAGENADLKLIRLRNRSYAMLKNDLVHRNPLYHLHNSGIHRIDAGCFGAVIARAGVGKTAFMVQLALDAILQGRNVLHISLTEPIQKVSLWYDEVFQHLTRPYRIEQIERLWEDILPHRFIMTFKAEGFSVPKLEERMTDLTEQGIIQPQIVILDGLSFDNIEIDTLQELKRFIGAQKLSLWFTVRTHRHEEPWPGDLPRQLISVSDLFDAVIQLAPTEEGVHIRAIKPESTATGEPIPPLVLDPTTMLVKQP